VKKRLSLLLALSLLASSAAPMMAQDAEAPEGVFLGTWPYVLPPDHHFNAYSSGGPNDNLGTLFRSYVELPPAIYNWGDAEYVGLLAESWGFAEDGSYYEVNLVPGAMWSDGAPITSEDVITTYMLGRLAGWSQWNYISGLEAIDEDTVHFIFSGEPSLVAERLILKEYIVSDATYGELADRAAEVFESGATNQDEAWTALATELTEFRPESIVASGPYTYTLTDVGDAFLTLNWQPNSIFSDTVNFGSVRLWAGETEVTTPLALSGELGHSTNVYPPPTIESFQGAGLRLIDVPRGYGPALLFNHSVAPWNIKEVRQAIAHAIDREQSAFLTNGIGASATVFMAGLLDDNVPQLLNQDVIDQLNPYEFNLEGAEALMTEAGFSRNAEGLWADADGNVISAEYTFPAEFADFAGAAQDAIAQLNAFGFDITARSLPWQEAAAAIRNGDFELSVWSWAQASPFAARQFFGPTQRFNTALPEGQPGIQFPMQFEWNGMEVDLDEMITRSSDGLDEAVQRERAGEVALIINDMLPFIPLNVQRSIEPINEDLIAGVPTEDSWLSNPTGSDHAIIYYLLTGVISPGPNAMGM
jgi:peptide/nickel transport system substrate-binding protein